MRQLIVVCIEGADHLGRAKWCDLVGRLFPRFYTCLAHFPCCVLLLRGSAGKVCVVLGFT